MALMECPECKNEISDKAGTCPRCGFPIADNYEATEKYRQPAPIKVFREKKSRSAAIFLAMLLGSIGAHKFYLNQPGWGVLYLLFCWSFIPGVLGVFEGLGYLLTSEEDFAIRYS